MRHWTEHLDGIVSRRPFPEHGGALRLCDVADHAASGIDELLQRLSGLAEGVFFAEDAFGDLFHCGPAGVKKFETLMGDVVDVCDDPDDFFEAVAQASEIHLGTDFRFQWQKTFGKVPAGHVLAPLTPLLMGGRYEVRNFRSCPRTEALFTNLHVVELVRVHPGERFRVVRLPGGHVDFRMTDEQVPRPSDVTRRQRQAQAATTSPTPHLR